jgi:hypothetical protein
VERSRTRCSALLLGFIAALCVGCTGTPTAALVDTAMPIASIDSVRGDWTGRIVSSPVGPYEQWIDLTIGGDGSYRYAAYRSWGVLAGSGKLTLVDGELHSESTSGKATYRLYDRGGKRLLKVEALENSGLRYLVELKPRSGR